MSGIRAPGARGRIGDYAWWQLRDYAMGPAIWTVLVVFVLGVFPLLMMKYASTQGSMPPQRPDAAVRQSFGSLVGIIAALGPMIAVARLASRDRAPGLSRFLFSQPVGVTRYYLQAWFVRWAALLGITLVVVLCINQLVSPVPWLEALGAVGISWVLVGGVAFLLTVLTAQDAGVLIGVYLIPTLLQALHETIPTWWWVKPLLAILPPMHKLDGLHKAVMQHTAMPQGDLWHVLLYGTACVALGAWLVRRLPLVR